MKSFIYLSIAALSLTISNVAYASSQKLTEGELSVVVQAVCDVPSNATEPQVENAVDTHAGSSVDANTLDTMKELAVQMLVLPDTAVGTICGY